MRRRSVHRDERTPSSVTWMRLRIHHICTFSGDESRCNGHSEQHTRCSAKRSTDGCHGLTSHLSGIVSPLWQMAGVGSVLLTRCGSFLFGWVLGSLCRTTSLQEGLKKSQALRVLAGLPLLFALRYLTLMQVYNADPDSQVRCAPHDLADARWSHGSCQRRGAATGFVRPTLALESCVCTWLWARGCARAVWCVSSRCARCVVVCQREPCGCTKCSAFAVAPRQNVVSGRVSAQLRCCAHILVTRPAETQCTASESLAWRLWYDQLTGPANRGHLSNPKPNLSEGCGGAGRRAHTYTRRSTWTTACW